MNWAVCLSACVFALFSLIPLPAQVEGKKASMVDHRLVYISAGKMEDTVNLNVHDMLQLQPFTYPITPKFIDAKLRVALKGDRVLDFIGQSSTASSSEGRGGASAFLYVHAKGRTEVTLTLVREDGEEIPGYRATYSVRAEEK